MRNHPYPSGCDVQQYLLLAQTLITLSSSDTCIPIFFSLAASAHLLIIDTRSPTSRVANPEFFLQHESREPYGYAQPADTQSSYYNGNYSSPRPSSFNRPRSPLSHSHPNATAGSLSPPSRQSHMTSPSLRHAATPKMTPMSNGGASMGSAIKSDLAAPSPPRPAPASSNVSYHRCTF